MADVLSPLARLDPAEAWRPWEPDSRTPWNLKWAGHLFRRAAFGATWTELQTALRQGHEETLRQLLAGKDGAADFDQVMDNLAPEVSDYDAPLAAVTHLQNWWLHRLLITPHPLQERLTLFWHNHFATSIAKVRRAGLMVQQNQLLRKHALGKFSTLLLEVSRDPAMLVWLDSNSNVKGRPNENYARELLELFSLGVGPFTEQDVREAARAFTGWQTTTPTPVIRRPAVQAEFVFRKYLHDDEPKTVLGQTGPWDGSDVVRIILEQPACARFLVLKLYRHFISEGETPPPRLLAPLAEQLRQSGYDIGALIRTMIRSRLFFSEHAFRQRIKGPVDYLFGLVRSLEGKPPPERGAMQPFLWLDGLGQALFAPPSVKGWDGGRAWLNTATLLARHNFAWRAVGGPTLGVNPLRLVDKHAGRGEYTGQIDFLLDLLLQPDDGEIGDQARGKLIEFLSKEQPNGEVLDQRLRDITHAILLLPLYQLA